MALAWLFSSFFLVANRLVLARILRCRSLLLLFQIIAGVKYANCYLESDTYSDKYIICDSVWVCGLVKSKTNKWSSTSAENTTCFLSLIMFATETVSNRFTYVLSTFFCNSSFENIRLIIILTGHVLGSQGWQRFFMRTMKTLNRLRGCAGWFKSSLDAHIRKYVSHATAYLSAYFVRSAFNSLVAFSNTQL